MKMKKIERMTAMNLTAEEIKLIEAHRQAHNGKARMEWINTHYDSFKKASGSSSIVSFPIGRKFVIVNVTNGKCAIAKCNPTDKCDWTIGKAVAWARYCGEPIPYYI